MLVGGSREGGRFVGQFVEIRFRADGRFVVHCFSEVLLTSWITCVAVTSCREESVLWSPKHVVCRKYHGRMLGLAVLHQGVGGGRRDFQYNGQHRYLVPELVVWFSEQSLSNVYVVFGLACGSTW